MKTKKAVRKSTRAARKAKVSRKVQHVSVRKPKVEKAAQIHQNIYAAELNRA